MQTRARVSKETSRDSLQKQKKEPLKANEESERSLSQNCYLNASEPLLQAGEKDEQASTIKIQYPLRKNFRTEGR